MCNLKILILGSTGLLGSYIFCQFSKDKKFKVFGLYKNKKKVKKLNYTKGKDEFVYLKDITDFNELKKIIFRISPDIVINCCGVIRQKKSISNVILTKKINSKLPIFLDSLTKKLNFKLIHFSTDCVFSGKQKKYYTEKSKKDATDIYGKTKSIGENLKYNSIIFRTSFIGYEFMRENKSLFNWLVFDSKKKVEGFGQAYFSGLTTLFISEFLKKNIKKILILKGIFNLSGKSINKFYLLNEINKIFKLQKIIINNPEPKTNKSLSNKKLKKFFYFHGPSWPKMLRDLKSCNFF